MNPARKHAAMTMKLKQRQETVVRQEPISFAQIGPVATPAASTSATTLETLAAGGGKAGKAGAKTAAKGTTTSTLAVETTIRSRSTRTRAAVSSAQETLIRPSNAVSASRSTVTLVSVSERVSVQSVVSTHYISASTTTAIPSHPTSIHAVPDSSVLAAASAWGSYTVAAAIASRKAQASLAAQAAWSAGPSGRASRLAASLSSAQAAAAQNSLFSANSALKLKASSLAALGTGHPLTAAPTQVWSPTSSVGFFAGPSQSATDDGSGAESGAANFFQSLGKTPTSIALTTIVCVAIGAVTLAIIAFVLRRWCIRRRKREMDRYPMFADDDGDYAQEEKFADPENDRWSVHSVIRRHSGDAAMEQIGNTPRARQFSQTSLLRDYNDGASQRTISGQLMPAAPQAAFAAPAPSRSFSNSTPHNEGYPSLRAFAGISESEPVSPVPSLPYISWTPPSTLPAGASHGPPVVPASRFSSFSTVLPMAPASVDRSHTTHSTWSASSYQDGTSDAGTERAAPTDYDDDDATIGDGQNSGDEDDDDETGSTASYQPDRVENFRRALSIAGTTDNGDAMSVIEALRARRQSTAGQSTTGQAI